MMMIPFMFPCVNCKAFLPFVLKKLGDEWRGNRTNQHTSISLLPSLPLIDKGTPQTPSPWHSNRNPDLKRGGWWPRSAPDRRPISYKKNKRSSEAQDEQKPSWKPKCEKWTKLYLWQISCMASTEVLVSGSSWRINCWTGISSWYRRNSSWYCSASAIRTPIRWFWHQTPQVYCSRGN